MQRLSNEMCELPQEVKDLRNALHYSADFEVEISVNEPLAILETKEVTMNTRQPIQESIVEICRELDELIGDNSDVANARRTVLKEQLELIGATAAFFGRYGAMKKLHDSSEELVDNTNIVGDRLNRAWDMIGGWAA